MHINSLCACWHSEAVKGSSSLFSRRLLISLWVTSPLFLCPELTDAPCPYYGGSVLLPQNGALIHRVRTHSLSRVKDTPLVRIRWIHVGSLSWSPPLPGPCPYVHHLCLFLWHCHDNGSRLLAGLLPGDHLPKLDGGPCCESGTEPRMTEPRMTEPRKTERRMTEPRRTEPRMTEPRIGPNLE
jgi:hypothetical protein